MFGRTPLVVAATTIAMMVSIGALWWFYTMVGDKAVLLEDVLQSLANEAALNRDQEILLELLSTTQIERETLNSYIINGDAGTIAFLSDMDAFAAARDLDLTTENLQVVAQGRAPFNALTMTYQVKGSEASVQSFLAALETLPYASEISRVELIRVNEADGSQPQTQGRITIAISVTDL
jgi:hypothetical protein